MEKPPLSTQDIIDALNASAGVTPPTEKQLSQAQVEEDKKESQKDIDEWKATSNSYIELTSFTTPRELIKVVLTTSQHNGLILHGEGGIGKSVLTLNEVKKELKAEEWEYSNGYTTPLALYDFLYKNRNKRVVILDDVEGVFDNHISLSILKGALWDSDGKRIVQYRSTSSKTSTLPDAFIITAKILVLCNKIPHRDDVSTRAMMSRTISYELNFNYAEKLDICEQFIMNDATLSHDERARIIVLLETETSEATKDFNFRTLRRAIAFIKYDPSKASTLFRATTEVDEVKRAYLDAMSESSTIDEAVERFAQLTTKSRATFFRLRKELGGSIKVSSEKDMTPMHGGATNGEKN